MLFHNVNCRQHTVKGRPQILMASLQILMASPQQKHVTLLSYVPMSTPLPPVHDDRPQTLLGAWCTPCNRNVMQCYPTSRDDIL